MTGSMNRILRSPHSSSQMSLANRTVTNNYRHMNWALPQGGMTASPRGDRRSIDTRLASIDIQNGGLTVKKLPSPQGGKRRGQIIGQQRMQPFNALEIADRSYRPNLETSTSQTVSRIVRNSQCTGPSARWTHVTELTSTYEHDHRIATRHDLGFVDSTSPQNNSSLLDDHEGEMSKCTPGIASSPREGDTQRPLSIDENINMKMSAYFPPDMSGKSRYLDSEIIELSGLLKHVNAKFSKVPRTYIVLRIIGGLHAMDELLATGFTDHWFPVTLESLPRINSLTPEMRSSIVTTQNVILTKSIDLEKGEARRHRHFGKGEDNAFRSISVLGAGGFGQVDKVLSLISYKEYARKRIHRRTFFGKNSSTAVKDYIDEIETLKRIKHRHIIELKGSYTDPTYFALLMSPVAQMDLSVYLKNVQPKEFATLRAYFGCLATALLYLHDNRIRHKDIKLQNILIHFGNVILADFGLAKESTHSDGTTVGVSRLTPRYCAPEVAQYQPRNSSSDIWSLGCVYLEMLAVLKGYRPDDMNQYFEMNGSKEPYVRTNHSATTTYLKKLAGEGLESDNKVIACIEEMIQLDRHARPTAATVMESLVCTPEHQQPDSTFCGLCCTYEDVSDSDDSLEDFLGDATASGTSLRYSGIDETVQGK